MQHPSDVYFTDLHTVAMGDGLQKKLENAMSVWELACMELEEISNS